MDKFRNSAIDGMNTEEEDDLIGRTSVHSFGSMRKPLEPAEGDNEHVTRFLNGVEGDPYLDVFYAVLSQVLDTPHQKTFFNLLQHLREIHLLRHPSGGEYVWETVEKFVCRLKLLRSPNEAHELLMRLLYQSGETSNSGIYTTSGMIDSSPCCCHCHAESTSRTPVAPVPLPPCPPPLPPPAQTSGDRGGPSTFNSSGDSRRPSFAEMISNAATSTSLKSSVDGRRSSEMPVPRAGQGLPRTPPPPPPNACADDLATNGVKLLPQQNLPQPKTKLKTFPWSKLPASKIVENVNNADNVWIKAARRFDSEAMISAINFDDLETLFAAQTSSQMGTIERSRGNENTNGQQLPNCNNPSVDGFRNCESNVSDYSNTLTRRRDMLSDINLLDRKRSLNVNIFLKQFRGGIDDLIELIATGCSQYLGLEKLRGLMKIVPESAELDVVRTYTGDKSRLGNAERFFLALTQITNYRLRVESMLLKEEFLSMVDYIKPSVNTLIAAASDLKNSQSLQEVLFLLLLVGNYLNAGGYGGNAAGFKMASLWKLVEIRANKPNVTLLHYVVAEIEKRNPKLLDLPKELKRLDDASKLSFDTILSDFRHLKEKTDRVSKQVAQTDADDEIRNQTEVFFEHARGELVTIERDLTQLDRLRLELAAFFCEDANTFKLEESLKIFASFCQRFSRAIDENAERRMQEEKAEMRRRLKEQQKVKKDLATLQKNGSSEPENPRRLSDKYKSLLNANDVVIPYHTDDPLRMVREKADQKHTSLVNVLTTSGTAGNGFTPQPTRKSISCDDEPSPGAEISPNSVNWRRSYNCKRRSTPVVSSTFTDRERPPEPDASQTKPWRQRFEELLAEKDQPDKAQCSASTVSLDTCTARKHSQDATRSVTHASNVDKAVECSPIFAKTFPRRETVRLGSVGDTEQCRLGSSLASVNEDSQTRCAPVEMRRSVWREQRRIRANSLLTDSCEAGPAPANDLNELLEILKLENGSNAAGRRRGSKVRSIVNSGSEDECDNQRKASTLSAPPEMPKTDIDEVVRHCEKARQEIDSMGRPGSATALIPTRRSESPISLQSARVSQPDGMECSVDVTLPASDLPDCISCNLVISCRGDDSKASQSLSDAERDCVQLSAVEASSHLTEFLDEGFEEDASNSTNSSSVVGIQSPPLLPASRNRTSQKTPQRQVGPSFNSKTQSASRSSQAPCKSVVTKASQTKCSYQSGTKASTLKAVNNPPAKPADSRSAARTSVRPAQKPVQTRSSAPSKVSKPKVDTDSPQKMTDPMRQRRAVSIGAAAKPLATQPKPTARPTSRPPTANRIMAGNESRPAAKARIQTVPTRTTPQRHRFSSATRNSPSASGSDSERRSPAPAAIRRR